MEHGAAVWEMMKGRSGGDKEEDGEGDEIKS